MPNEEVSKPDNNSQKPSASSKLNEASTLQPEAQPDRVVTPSVIMQVKNNSHVQEKKDKEQ